MKKYWTKARPKPSRANSKTYNSISDVKGLDDSAFPALLTAVCFSPLSWLVPVPVCSSPWQGSYGSGMSNILWSPRWSRLHIHSLMQWPLMQGLHCHTTCCVSGFPYSWKKIPQLLYSCIFDYSKAKLMWTAPPVWLLTWDGAWLFPELHFQKLSFVAFYEKHPRPFFLTNLGGWDLSLRAAVPLSILCQASLYLFQQKPWLQH